MAFKQRWLQAKQKKAGSPAPPAPSLKAAQAATPEITAFQPASKEPDVSIDAQTEALIDDLREKVRAAGVQRNDPMMPVAIILASLIRFFGGSIKRLEQIVERFSQRILGVLSESHRFAEAETRRFELELAHKEADLVQRVSSSIAQKADQALTRRVQVYARNTALVVAGALFSVSAACLGGGYWWGYHEAMTDFHETEAGLRAAFSDGPQSAQKWLQLMQWNILPNALAQCRETNLSTQNGRRGCRIPLWIEPSSSLSAIPDPEPEPPPSVKPSGWPQLPGLRPTGPVEFH